MEDTTCCNSAVQTPSSGRLPAWATRKRMMTVAGAAAVFGGLTLNWGWLTAIGVAPILLTLAPCGIMCAVGLCAMGGKKTPGANTVIPINPPAE